MGERKRDPHVSQVLEFSKLSAEENESGGASDLHRSKINATAFAVSDLAENLLDIVGAQANDHGVDLVLAVEPSLYGLQLLGDTFRVAQSTSHIIDNAVRR